MGRGFYSQPRRRLYSLGSGERQNRADRRGTAAPLCSDDPGTRASASAAAAAFLPYAPAPPWPRPRDGAAVALSAGRGPRAFHPPHRRATVHRRCDPIATGNRGRHWRTAARYVELTRTSSLPQRATIPEHLALADAHRHLNDEWSVTMSILKSLSKMG